MAWTPWFIRRRRDRERAEELQSHLAHHIEDLIGRGVAPDEARRQARVLFGNPRATREDVEAMQTLPVADAFVRDLKYAGRVLRKSPGFTLTAIGTLALVIGANTAVFSLANGLLFTPLPYPDPDRLMLVHTDVTTPRGVFGSTAQDAWGWEALRDTRWADRAAVFSDMFSGVNFAIGTRALIVDQQRVGAGFFKVLGIAPRLGREFEPAEDVPNGPPVVILSHQVWQSAFAGDTNVLGRSVLLRGEPWTVVGVMPEGFRSTVPAGVWTPLRPSTAGEGSGTNYRILFRLPADVARGEVAPDLARAIDPTYVHRDFPDGVSATTRLESLTDAMTADMSEVIGMLGASALTVLLIACVNLTGLLLARGETRTKEIATRMALGSGRRAVVRQLMVESLVLAACGGAGGLLIGWLGLNGLQALAGQGYADWQRVTMDARVVIVSGIGAVLTCLLFGTIPALQASRVDIQAAFSGGGSRAVAGGGRHWTRRGLIVAEVALGLVLLVAAGLLFRTFVNLRSLEPGFEPEGLVTASVSLLDARYPGPVEVNRLFDRTLDGLRRAPGIHSSSVSLGLPFERVLNMGFRFPEADKGETASVMYASSEFFETLRIPLRTGRGFAESDTAASLPVVVVNEAFRDIYSAEREVLGRRVRLSGAERHIVGVVADVQQRPGFIVEGMVPGPVVASPTIYLPVRQVPAGIVGTHLWFPPVFSVRADSPARAEQALAAAVASADPLLPIAGIREMSAVRDQATSQEQMLMTLVGTLAAVALMLTAIGLHGLVASAVTARRREFSIRMALGATPAATVRSVLAGGLRLSAVGAAIGVALAIPASSLVASWLYGVAEHDVMTYVAASAFLLIVAGLASLLPALTLLRLDPAQTLR